MGARAVVGLLLRLWAVLKLLLRRLSSAQTPLKWLKCWKWKYKLKVFNMSRIRLLFKTPKVGSMIICTTLFCATWTMVGSEFHLDSVMLHSIWTVNYMLHNNTWMLCRTCTKKYQTNECVVYLVVISVGSVVSPLLIYEILEKDFFVLQRTSHLICLTVSSRDSY